MTELEIATHDGRCPSYVWRPPGRGPWPAVLVYMDGIGIRPAMLEVGERLATQGYFVLLPDLFYRSGRYTPMNATDRLYRPGGAQGGSDGAVPLAGRAEDDEAVPAERAEAFLSLGGGLPASYFLPSV